ncbi:MAG: DUF3494 domain-containing protein, partial [Opitutae bacterium]|nr:DUF3494 domain-containing protein [Opitutae bacterium]
MNIKRLFPLPVAAIAAFLFSGAAGFSQTVLLTAGDFALLGGTAISVGGAGPNPITNGNVGLSPGATTNITGFPPATVSGNTLSGSVASIVATGGVTAQARADLITAQNALAAMASNTNLTNIDLGTVAPLNSGVYTFNAAAAQTGALVLDAQGQNGVFWVFQIGTSLTTSANSTVTFINLGSNGGTDNGLFWNAGAGITIGDNNTIVGNYLSGTSISFTGITTTLGGGGSRALALAGVSFAGPGAINPLGGPGGGDFDGGLMYNGLGALVPITGNVLLSSAGAYTQGASSVVLVPGTALNTSTVTIDGASRDGSGAASLTINSAAVTLTGTNTYTGATTLNAGTLSVATIGDGGVAGNLGQASATATNLTLGGGTLRYTGATAATNRNFVLTAGTTSAIDVSNAATNLTVSGASTATTGALTKSGAGTLTLSGTNAHTGGTTVAAGTLQLGNSGTVLADAGAVTVNGGTLALGTAGETIGSLAGSGGTVELFNVSGRTLAAGGDNTSTSFAGVIQGSGGALVKTGTGTLTLSGANTYSGGTTVSAGTLAGNTTSLQGAIANNAAVLFNQTTAGTYAGVMSGTGTLA